MVLCVRIADFSNGLVYHGLWTNPDESGKTFLYMYRRNPLLSH